MNTSIKPNWVPASVAWMSFCEAHPELGFKSTPSSWAYFRRIRAERLIESGVIRRVSQRHRLIADTTRFDLEVFELLTKQKSVAA